MHACMHHIGLIFAKIAAKVSRGRHTLWVVAQRTLPPDLVMVKATAQKGQARVMVLVVFPENPSPLLVTNRLKFTRMWIFGSLLVFIIYQIIIVTTVTS